MSLLRATPHKHRRTKAELEGLDAALTEIVASNRPCTVRQAYYLAVVAGLVEKTVPGYKAVQRRLLHLRREGTIPYSSILDNVRLIYGRIRYRDRKEFLLAMSRAYALDYWQDEDLQLELWCESDSIAGVLAGTVDAYGLRLFVARGFSSETFLEKAALNLEDDGRPAHVLILSDYDPSGVSLADDIAKKLRAFTDPLPVTVQRIALSGEQVSDWNLPTHDLKATDSRTVGFRQRHGNVACELEAVPPPLLRQLVSEAITQHVDPARIEAARREEQLQRESLEALPDWFWGDAA